jgi:hypothetical protein
MRSHMPPKTPAAPPQTAAEIAAAVLKPDDLRAATRVLRSLRADRESASHQHQMTISETGPHDFSAAKVSREFEAKLKALDLQIIDALRKHDEAIAAYFADISAAVAPLRTVAEADLRTAFDALLGALCTIDAVDAELRRVGGSQAAAVHISAPQLKAMFSKFVADAIGRGRPALRSVGGD